MGRSIRVHHRACWLNNLTPRSCILEYDASHKGQSPVNLTLLAAVVLLLVWFVLVFVVQVPNGTQHLLYAAAAILFARRILAGAPRFVS